MKKPEWLQLNKFASPLMRRAAWSVVLVALIALGYNITTGKLKTGFESDTTVTKSEKKHTQTKDIETTITTTYQDGKTLWDWLSLLGVPLSLLILGYWLQQLQQERADQQAKAEKEIAEANQREEALQNYLDRVSELLIEKNLIAKATKLQAANANPDKNSQINQATLEDQELLNASVDAIRARTLSILRRLRGDGERKGNVVRFLVEAKVLSELKLSLAKADLSNANLVQINLSEANLSGAIFCQAHLAETQLSGANLRDADFNGADLTIANFSNADLTDTHFKGASLREARLTGAKLIRAELTCANLSAADLRGAQLGGADISNAVFTDAMFHKPFREDQEKKARESIQSAQNWEKAHYDPAIRAWLGLTPELHAKECSKG